MLDVLEEAYDYPVDIEFTANFLEDGQYHVNLLQCRPLQVKGSEAVDLPKIKVAEKDCIIKAHGAVVGQSRVGNIDRFIYVVPSRYGQLPINARYEVARLIGEINRVKGAEAIRQRGIYP